MAGFPDSPAPFNPINKRGELPKMPDGWTSPLRKPLYRVCVDWRGEPQPVAITPAMVKEVAEAVCISAAQAIKSGAKPFWSNPSVVLTNLG